MKSAMRWLVLGVSLAAVAAVAAPTPAAAQEEKDWSVEVALDYSSLYMFRGINLLGEDQEVWNPHAAVTFGNFTAYTYGYIGKFDAFDDFGNVVGEGDYEEIDLGAEYAFAFGEKFSLTLGGVAYFYNGETEVGTGYLDTFEIYAIASWDVLLAPTITYAQDVDQIDGGFLALDLSYSFEFSDKVSLDLLGQIGFDFGYNQPGDDEARIEQSQGDLNHWMLGADLPIQFTDSFAGHVMVQQFFSLDVAQELEQDVEFVVTAGLAYTF